MNKCSNTHASACIVNVTDLPDFLYNDFFRSYPLFLCGIAFDYFLENGLFEVLVIL